MLDWMKLIPLSNSELVKYDVVDVNRACAEGIPGVPFLTDDECETKLRQFVAGVTHWTEERAWLFEKEPERFDHSWDRYRMACLVSVLQWKFNLLRDPEWTFEDGADTVRSVGDVPVYHLWVNHAMKGGYGCCASLPIIFCSVGRRLGYPLKLVLTKHHMFLRWDDAQSGSRFNIECTSHGFDTPPDEYYKTWPGRISDWEVVCHNWLVSMTPKEELQCFLRQRVSCIGEINTPPKTMSHEARLREQQGFLPMNDMPRTMTHEDHLQEVRAMNERNRNRREEELYRYEVLLPPFLPPGPHNCEVMRKFAIAMNEYNRQMQERSQKYRP